MNEYNRDGVIDLATAVVVQCEKDYVNAERINNGSRKNEIERFFNSGWGSMLTFGNNQAILEKIQKKAEIAIEKRDQRKNAWHYEDVDTLKKALKKANCYADLRLELPHKKVNAIRAKVKSMYGTENFKKLKMIIERG